jgi:hypothetical protein
MAAIGSLIGVYGVLCAGFLAAIIGGIYALAVMCFTWGIMDTVRQLAVATSEALIAGKTWAPNIQLPFRLRYALPIAGGTLLYLAGVQPFGG